MRSSQTGAVDLREPWGKGGRLRAHPEIEPPPASALHVSRAGRTVSRTRAFRAKSTFSTDGRAPSRPREPGARRPSGGAGGLSRTERRLFVQRGLGSIRAMKVAPVRIAPCAGTTL